MGRYLIGIDLGTTNSALSYVDLQSRPRAGAVVLQSFPIVQKRSGGETGPKDLLPSFLYLPGEHDLPPGSAALPWNANTREIVGEFARTQGARVPGRLVSSAKSWLSHTGVDRTAALLPWGAPPEVPRLSPLEVSTRYLKHLADAWNHAPGRSSDDRLEEQAIVLTVPASFDDVARSLTMQAAQQAGYKQVTLLEEPQAAFYSWLGMNAVEETARMKPGMRCLVVDVGGGTSDFSLIRADEAQGELSFHREAVGDHLLLGGDNMDLALARFAETQLKAKLDAAQFANLVQQCRQAKEQLLDPAGPSEVSLTIMGRGRSVIGGSLHTTLTRDQLQTVLFQGFFPNVPWSAEPQRATRGGLQEMSLPYVADPGISAHLAQFLRQHLPADPITGKPVPPDAILFNGGVFQPTRLREQLIEVMRPWFADRETPWEPLVLANPSLDLAVAWGAAYFGWLKHTGGKRIGGGIPRSYYLAVGGEIPNPPDQESPERLLPTDRQTVLCIVPRGLEEGQIISLGLPVLELSIGRPVLFPLYTSTVRVDDRPGDVLAVAPSQLLELPPLFTQLRGGKRAGIKQVPVTLESRTTEIGTLELFCVAQDGGNRWKLEFNVRDIVKEAPARAANAEDAPDPASTLVDVFPEALVEAATHAIHGCYHALPDAPNPADLPKVLESALESSRNDWPSALCRRLVETLLEVGEHRRRSLAHANRWYHLLGFTLRPGYGDALDRFRVESLWKLLNVPAKPGTPQTVSEGGADYWIMWRRVNGGLNTALQQQLANRLRAALVPSKGKSLARPAANEWAEMWRCLASLERLDARLKEQFAEPLLRLLQRPPVPNFVFWCLTRLGARRLLYGPLNTIVHPQIVENWLDQILSFQPSHDTERLAFQFCLAQMSRMTGQRALDIDDSHRQSVLALLRNLNASDDCIAMVESVVDTDSDQSQLFGDALPIGLRLLPSAG
ncbi:hsp70 family protein [Tuwongella immobilis]|uniref:Molecular chaperone DnaK n=1 Tax=Tuwongella immobilis TaxID=692036 RepID=A0A6C2YUZ8_9BACT|nr:hsp70 family protein [Tuwongella immobilis]VIP05274.1 Molecular chaperone OS=Singulisphaera acidiphila (strain ATCC BAA-1392 / DSM 18658 / VKM B-2454 / MOB10) GN=Sinac_3051 PE=3 SV=1: HSP70: DUF3731 [Tuwongella immobilis]VTS07904.1 Molecular chaperone OS=Singulisphaera acidiphila (strain ATCC BAA-1392 / DSM 18658 / VKM B-2454 / MOB10) GN=Sinac_3051 PE=3 SV=1: HSP70: DUF3731 [Tuwongella immobilis]